MPKRLPSKSPTRKNRVIFHNTAALFYFHFIYLNFTNKYKSLDFTLVFDSQFQNATFSLDISSSQKRLIS